MQDTLHEDQYTFMNISQLVLFGVRMFRTTKVVLKLKTHISCSTIFFF